MKIINESDYKYMSSSVMFNCALPSEASVYTEYYGSQMVNAYLLRRTDRERDRG